MGVLSIEWMPMDKQIRQQLVRVTMAAKLDTIAFWKLGHWLARSTSLVSR